MFCCSLRQQVTKVVLLHLVYLRNVVYNSEEINLGSCRCKNILRVKGQAKITKCYFLRRHNQYALIEWSPLNIFNVPTSTRGVLTSLTL